jgi:hypothetical protein
MMLQYEWPWPIDLKINRGYLLTMTILPTKYEDRMLNDTQVIDGKLFGI